MPTKVEYAAQKARERRRKDETTAILALEMTVAKLRLQVSEIACKQAYLDLRVESQSRESVDRDLVVGVTVALAAMAFVAGSAIMGWL